jgi:two-component system cell cycle sensor histidine kinase/response regulator CckA
LGRHIAVASERGQGTTFRIYLPKTDSAESALGESAEPPPKPGNEIILLAEDDTNLRALTRDVLQGLGYRVLESQDVEDALRIAQRREQTIQLLITDVVMPHMNGRALAEAIKVTQPQVKVLYMTGYTDDAIVHHGVLAPGTALLQKPFTPGTLVRKVRQVLDQPA